MYFQPPPSTKMKYPAIVYGLEDIENVHANGGVYLSNPAYSLIYIDEDPDNSTVGRIAKLPLCRFKRHYRVNNLNHYAFTLFF